MACYTIDRLPVTLNKRQKMHHMAIHKDAISWRQWVAMVMRYPPLDYPEIKRRVYIRVLRGKLQDPDNAVASVKPVLDALVWAGWLVDDSPEWCAPTVEEKTERGRKNRNTTIEVWAHEGE